MLNQSITGFLLEFTVSSGKRPASAKHHTGFPATSQPSFDRARVLLRRTQERNRRNFDWLLFKGRERIMTDAYFFTDKWNGVTESPKLGHLVE